MSNRIVILGGGESGAGAAILAKTRGFDVFLSDFGKIADKYKALLQKYDITFEEEMHTEELILNADEVIKSPGIPDKVAIVKKIREKNIPVISEIEFAGRYTNAKMICITGANGKTTTTLLTYHIFKKAGLNVGLAGNVGQSFALQVAENNFDYYVIELSSFQLDGMYKFKADVAILTNITPDHLDRYEYQFQNYIDSKFRVIQNQLDSDHFIYCIDDEVTMIEMEKRKPGMVLMPFSIKKEVGFGAYANDEKLFIKTNNTQLTMSIQELALQGKHNTYNSMAAGLAASVYKIRKDIIRECLTDFQSIEHRLEPVFKVHGIEFINDSKATNVNSTWYALESVEKPIVWIAGGIDKGNDYSSLTDLVKQKVKAIICMGKDNSKIHKAFDGICETIVDTSSMHDAVRSAYYLAKQGDTVLLSPACASFDLFENYEDRGRKFKFEVGKL
ncbi:MAG: UDP-N-acetylmuramoylalanine--D-glutamate ligase [Bacteroidetes bacterium GWF2_38_335]|nr:MAG: UDP-N-acetylmuramoylalanine--D-glutamate ligase [Bacteroidetes bacterium GWF2_38_335]OFY79674.1 MAG: UDP-N-acetylmuramoylalanine--D-glutamate ligase [Bacteroidetes bacterium RIFOXYA12_FULL_38_20]HBS89002.1 UDP-N-acetylmuramoyl-L-alanine--D-glutamate ligase [Bacteroidales bacterium]